MSDKKDQEISRLKQQLSRTYDRLVEIEASETRRAESVRRSEASYRELVENVNSIILRMDPQGHLTFMNRFAQNFFGYSESEWLGKNILGTLVPAVDGNGRDLAERIRNVCRDPELFCNNENENVLRDGRRVWISWANKAILNEHGQVKEILCIGNDVTERKRLDQAMQTSECTYREIFDATMNAIFVHEIPSGRIIDVNRTMLDMFGCTREEAMQMDFWRMVSAGPPYTPADAIRLMRKAVAEGQQVVQWPVCRKNGEKFWVEVVVKQAVIGGVPRVLTMMNDITHKKQIEQRLVEEQQALHALLDSQERERGLIAYEIHDGLAQHLAAAAMYCCEFDRLRESDPEKAVQAHQTGGAMLQKAASEARRLIQGLRPPVLDEAGLVAAIDNLITETKNTEEVAIEFVHDVHFDRLEPTWENSLFRIVQESLGNAVKHSCSDQFRIRLLQKDERLVLEIQDWGKGFEPGQVGQGCFGLRGIRERAGLLGGTATIDSRPGGGTMVCVKLPMARAACETAATPVG